jgi:hypothetical protein
LIVPKKRNAFAQLSFAVRPRIIGRLRADALADRAPQLHEQDLHSQTQMSLGIFLDLRFISAKALVEHRSGKSALFELRVDDDSFRMPFRCNHFDRHRLQM